jgi:hypothetical protein
MAKFVRCDVFSWREENYFRSLGYYPFMTLFTRQAAQALRDELAHSSLNEQREFADLCSQLSDQLQHDQPPFIFMPNEEAVRTLLPLLENADDNELFTMSGKWLDQLRWLDRDRKRKEKT